MAKSASTDSAPGDRLLRLHLREIEREIDSVKLWYDEASQSGDEKRILRINDALMNIETAANKLRSAEAPKNLEARITAAIKNADEVLSSYASLHPPTPPGVENHNENHDDGSVIAPPVHEGSP